MQEISDKLIVALDVDKLERAERLVNVLYPSVKLFKVGSQLFTACGPQAVIMVGKKGAKVFLDLKFHDIPNTVFLSVGTGMSLNLEIFPDIHKGVRDATQSAVFMMTVHTGGGLAMLREAVRGAKEKSDELKISRPFIIGVTRLTSDSHGEDTRSAVLEAAYLAKDAGLDGVVCSVFEAAEVRKACGKDFIIVTPGIRPKGAKRDDQKRVATAEEAIKAGADYIVVGRPILEAPDPLKAAKEILCQKS